MRTNSFDAPVLVLGGTGKTGRRVAQRLRAGGHAVRIGTPSADPPFDWNRPATWPGALAGVRAAYVLYYSDLASPGAVEAVGSFADLAVSSGVDRLVLLRGRGEPENERGEQAVRASGARLTVLRSSFFNQDFSEDYMLEHIRTGVLALPAGDAREPFVDAEDIADVAVAALTDDRHVGEVYELTGPRLLSFADAAEEIGRAAGREVRYEPVSSEEHAEASRAAGVPEPVITLLTYIFSEVLDGRNAHTTDDVERALGRPPTDFAEFARRTAATGVWSTAPLRV